MLKIPHAGMRFEGGDTEEINHNYMHSVWMLLIMMALLSFLAQRRWANIFNHDILRSILKLPGHEQLELVKLANQAQGYERLAQLGKRTASVEQTKSSPLAIMSSGDGQQSISIDLLFGNPNAHNHLFDYYSNQLIYLLMADRASDYRLASMNLRRKLVVYSLFSFTATWLQYLLPRFFIGEQYRLYGWRYFQAWLRYMMKLSRATKSKVNSIDYELSSSIWPTSTMCEYHQYGYQGMDTIVVQCVVPINEICGKLFAFIWWFVAFNIIIETFALISMLTCSISFSVTKRTFGFRFWPKASREATIVSNFRYNRLKAVQRRLKETGQYVDSFASKSNNLKSHHHDKFASCTSISDKSWLSQIKYDLCRYLSRQGRKLGRRSGNQSGVELREIRRDVNILYLFYLMYLRFNKSQKRVEQVIKMTSEALDSYLIQLNDPDSNMEIQMPAELNRSATKAEESNKS